MLPITHHQEVIREPVVREADVAGEVLITDLGLRGVWQPQTEVLFDIHVIDTDAQSHVCCTVLSSAERKRSVYIHPGFTGIFFSLYAISEWVHGM